MTELDQKLIKVIPKSNKELGMINSLKCILMNREEKIEVINYLNSINNIKISDEDFAKYIEEILIQKKSNFLV